MALAARDIPITRSAVQEWIDAWNHAKNLPNFDASLKDYIAQKLDELGYSDTEVDTSGHDTLADSTPLLEMIWMDISSYAGSSP